MNGPTPRRLPQDFIEAKARMRAIAERYPAVTEKTMPQGNARDIRSVRRVTFTEVIVLRGEGTPEDLAREVVMIFDDNGTCVAEHDPKYPTPWYAPMKTCDEARAPLLLPEPRCLVCNGPVEETNFGMDFRCVTQSCRVVAWKRVGQ